MLKREPGAAVVAAALEGAAISATNHAEVLARPDLDRAASIAALGLLGLPVRPFSEAESTAASTLILRYRGVLSLADCACIATAELLGIPVLTADRVWATLPLGIEVRLIRP